MPVDADLRRTLLRWGRSPLEPDLDRFRASSAAIGNALRSRPAATVATRDFAIDGPGGGLEVRIYVPETRSPPPLTVFLHGGGFVAGSIETHDAPCRELAVAAETAVLSIAYRLAPENPFPAAIDDAYATLLWAARNGTRLDLDVSRLAIAGDSAGANLAIATTRLARDRSGPRVRAQWLMYPPTDLLGHHPSRREFADGYAIDDATLRLLARTYAPTPDVAGNPLVSPLRCPRLGGLPRTLVVTCEFDPLRDEGMALARALGAARSPVDHWTAEGMIHGFISFTGISAGARREFDRAARWLRDRLRPHPARMSARRQMGPSVRSA